jgi:BirA family biotin operon repressor/biotin-[acetyl-CoA-carboxylase] ligase
VSRDEFTVTGLDADLLRGRLLTPTGPYAAVDVVASTGSTNVDLAAAARTGAADRTALIADRQTAGQGRRSRSWSSPSGVGVYASVLLRPAGVSPARLGWLTLLAGVAALRTARSAGAEAGLKWPNDLLGGNGKCAGVLAEALPGDSPAVVVGIGLNVLPLPEAAPPGVGGLPASSLAAEGATVLDRTELAVRLLGELAALESAWRAAGGDPVGSGLAAAYREGCGTIGRPVRVELPGERVLTGTAVDVDDDGRLVVADASGGRKAISAGDVVHLRTQA